MPKFPTIKIGSNGYYVKILQMDLNGLALNFNNFAMNGFFDEKTLAATRNFQDRFELSSNGVVDPLTWKLLIDHVKSVQRLLIIHGYNAGHIDGIYGLTTINAVHKFQTNNGLYPTGIIDPRTRRKLFNPHPKDQLDVRPSSNDLSSLHPHVALLAKRFLTLTRANHLDVRITTAFRSWADQDNLFAQGRSIPGSIVTNARGGDSYHNWGLAFDAVPYTNGQMSNDSKKFFLMGHLGEKVGLKWGGTFKSIVDYPHFQYTFGLNTWDLLNGVSSPKNKSH